MCLGWQAVDANVRIRLNSGLQGDDGDGDDDDGTFWLTFLDV
jgi:hypothetical protein